MSRRAAALIAALLGACSNEAAPAETPKPTVHVLTSLPLLFDEGFGLEPVKSGAGIFLRERYILKSIDLPSQLPAGATLLAAQPRALPAEELVALDQWVRGGGRLVLLADPMLEWPSDRALGDRMRPPVSFADTGLLVHWGLRLDAPERRKASGSGGGRLPMTFISAGRLVGQSANCQFFRANVGVKCRIGRGQAIIIADADWLNDALVEKSGGRFANHLAELDDLIAESPAR